MIDFPKSKTKIVCTIGPASQEVETLTKMIENGMNIARINFAHGSFEEHETVVENIRKASKIVDKDVTIMGDLPGPKIRIGDIKPMEIKKGDILILSEKPQEGVIPINFKDFSKYVKVGDSIYMNDGFVELMVEKVEDDKVYAVSLSAGKISSHKGVNLPNVDLPVKAIGEYEKRCIDFAKKIDMDAISVSFVKDQRDVIDAKEYCNTIDYHPFIIAKIERPQALKNIDEILEASDGIMVARGDLGIETPIECIAMTQKHIIKKANLAGKPVITATQMLESMVESPRPTRAEASDVANAILDGTDCIMVSEETAIGKHPDLVVSTLANIAACAEKEFDKNPIYKAFLQELSTLNTLEDIMAYNAFNMAKHINASLVIVPTTSGTTARRMSKFKLPVWVLGITRDERVKKHLRFSYGVFGFYDQNPPTDKYNVKAWKEYIKNIVGDNLYKSLQNTYAVLLRGHSKRNKDVGNSLEIIKL